MNTKRCHACEQVLPNTAFSYGRGMCRECRASASRNLGRYRSQTLWRASSAKRCVVCDRVRPAEMFKLHASTPDGLTDRCRDCKDRPAYQADAVSTHHALLQRLMNNVPAYARGNLSPVVHRYGVAA